MIVSNPALFFLGVDDLLEVDVEVVMAKEQEAYPGLERVHGDNEEDPDNPPLLRWVCIVSTWNVCLN